MLARLLTPIARRLLQPPYRPPRALPPAMASRARDVTIGAAVRPIKAWLIPGEAPTRGTVLFVHGWSSDGGRMASLARPLTERGFAVLLVDLPGHGRTGPVKMYNAKLMVEDIAIVRDWMAANADAAPRPWAILGYSFGGLGAYVSAARDPRWSAVVLLAAPIGPMEATKFYFDGMGLPGSFLVHVLRPSFVRLVGVDPETFEGLPNLRTLRVPVMIVHGDDDQVVPVSHAEGLAALVPEGLGTLVRVPGADHNALMTDEIVGRRIAAFLTEHLEVRT